MLELPERRMALPAARRLTLAAAAALSMLSLVSPAFALCAICNASVRLDTRLAACFEQRAETEIARLKSEGRGFVIVNLSNCEESAPVRSALPTSPASATEVLDSSFIADGDALACLRAAIDQHSGSMDPSYLFDLKKLCGP